MAATKRVAALNLGMQTATMAVFDAAPGNGLVLSGVARAGLQPDPAADSSRPGQLRIALGELRSKLKWTGGTAVLALPSQGVFARFVKIPKVEPEKVGQMLLFEAQQNVPFPIEEVSWGYQVLPESEPDKLGALILATKLDGLEATVEAVQSAGFAADFIETSPVALYNALRYNYPELTGCTLLIDIGARATNLIFAEGDRLFFRTLPVGGSSITAAMQKKLEGRPFAEIEDFKTKQALIPPPGSHEETGDAAELGKVARTVMTRVHNEITRSITHYRTNQQGSAPVRVFLAGGGASLPFSIEFFNEKLSLPVEFFNPLHRLSIAPSAATEEIGRYAHTLGECVGLAASALVGDCPLNLNLQSPRLETARRERQRPPFLAAAVLLLAAALGAAFLHFQRAANHLVEEGQKL
ncbi:MAG: type pilus assembly protein PilM, partial [Verrucomicrobiota bacterium]